MGFLLSVSHDPLALDDEQVLHVLEWGSVMWLQWVFGNMDR